MRCARGPGNGSHIGSWFCAMPLLGLAQEGGVAYSLVDPTQHHLATLCFTGVYFRRAQTAVMKPSFESTWRRSVQRGGLR